MTAQKNGLPSNRNFFSNDRFKKQAHDYLTLAETANVLQVSTDTIRRWSQNGKLESFRTAGGHRRFLRLDVEALIPHKPHHQQQFPKVVISSSTPSPLPSPVISTEVTEGSLPNRRYSSIGLPESHSGKGVILQETASTPLRNLRALRLFAAASLCLAGLFLFRFSFPALSQVPVIKELRGSLLATISPLSPSAASDTVKRSKVLQASDIAEELILRINVPVQIGNDLTVEGDLNLTGSLASSGNSTFENITVTDTADISTSEIGTLLLGGTTVTSTATELNYLDGLTLASGGVVYSTSTGLQVSAVGTANQILISNGSSAPTWKNVSEIQSTDASTLDGLDSTQFLRSDTSDAFTSGTLTISGSRLVLSSGTPFAVGGSGAEVAYNVIGDSITGASASMDSDDDLYIEGDLEVDGTIIGNVSGSVITSLTPGSVVFVGAAGELAEDNANFFFDNTNNRLGLGTLSPSYQLHVAGTTGLLGTTSLLGDVTFGDATTDLITFTSRLASGSSIIPAVDLGSDLGTASLRYNNIYAANLTIDNGFTSTGQLLVTYNPTDTTFAESSIRVNVTTPATNEQMLGIGQAGEERASIDAEGDLTLGYDGAAGSSVPESSNPLNIYGHNTTLVASIDTSGNLTLTGTTFTGTSLTTFNCTDCINFDDLADAMSLDAATDINLSTFALTIDMDSTGDFSIRDGTTDIATFTDAGAITFAPTTALVNITGDLDVSDQGAFGDSGTITSGVALIVDEAYTDTSGVVRSGYFLNQAEAAGASTATHYAVHGQARLDTINGPATLYGVYGSANLAAAGTVTTVRGVVGQALLDNGITGTVTNLSGTLGIVDVEDGTVTSAHGGYFETPSIDTGSLTTGYGILINEGAAGVFTSFPTQYGLRISAMDNAATNNYGIWGDAGDWVLDHDGAGTSGGTTGGGDILLGEDQDLELYHDGTNSYIMNNTGDLYIGDAGTDDVILSANGGLVGIGTAAPISKLHVATNTTTLTGKAALIVDQLESQDILSASASGISKMTLTRDGFLGLGITAPLEPIHTYVNDTSVGSTIRIEQAGTGDSALQFLLTAQQAWVMGIDNSDGDKFKFASTVDVGTDTVLTLDTAGNVGIGTTTPSANLSIGNNVATGFLDTFAEYQVLLYTAAGPAGSYGLGVNANSMVFNSGGGGYSFDRSSAATTMTLDTVGKVGIGTVSPISRLHVATNTSTLTGKAALIVDQLESQDIFTASASGVTRFVINNAGNVGIGTDANADIRLATSLSVTDPASLKIGISSSMTLNATSANAQDTIGIIGSTVSNPSTGITHSGTTYGVYGAATNTGLGISTKLIGLHTAISNQGGGTTTDAIGVNVSIANTSGTITTGYGVYLNDIAGTTDYGIFQSATNDDNYFGGVINRFPNISSSAGNRSVCFTDADGSLTKSSTTCTNPSSIAFKENISNLDYGLDDLMKLHPVSYNFKASFSDDTSRKIGFIAEEVLNVIPELVQFDRNGTVIGLEYDKLTSLNTKSIQELALQVNTFTEATSYLKQPSLPSPIGSHPEDTNPLEATAAATLTEFTTHYSITDSVLSFLKKVIFKARVTFEDTVAFVKNVNFKGKVTLNADTTGTITIPTGSRRVKVTFKQAFDTVPVIYVTSQSDLEGGYGTKELTKESFIIELTQTQSHDVSLNWLAVISDSDEPGANVEILDPATTPSPEPSNDSEVPSPSPTSSPTPTLSPSPTATPEPTLTPTPSLEPTPEATSSGTTQ